MTAPEAAEELRHELERIKDLGLTDTTPVAWEHLLDPLREALGVPTLITYQLADARITLADWDALQALHDAQHERMRRRMNPEPTEAELTEQEARIARRNA